MREVSLQPPPKHRAALQGTLQAMAVDPLGLEAEPHRDPGFTVGNQPTNPDNGLPHRCDGSLGLFGKLAQQSVV